MTITVKAGDKIYIRPSTYPNPVLVVAVRGDPAFDKAIVHAVLDFLRDNAAFDEDDTSDPSNRAVYCSDSNRSVDEADILACIEKARVTTAAEHGKPEGS